MTAAPTPSAEELDAAIVCTETCRVATAWVHVTEKHTMKSLREIFPEGDGSIVDGLLTHIKALRQQVVELQDKYDELRVYHDKSMLEIAKTLGEDITDEPRFKWVNLAAHRIVRELTASRERAERLERALTIASDSFRSHGFAVDADECDEALAPASDAKEDK